MSFLLMLAAFGVVYAGFALLALAQERHWSTVTGGGTAIRPAPGARQLRQALGALGLALGLALCLVAEGPAFGGVVWVMMLGAGACAVAFTLAWRPALLRRLAA